MWSRTSAWPGLGSGCVDGHLIIVAMISTWHITVVVTLVSLVRRRARRVLLVAWQRLVDIVGGVVVVDILRRPCAIVLAARIPSLLAAAAAVRGYPLVSGFLAIAIRVTYIVGLALGCELRGCAISRRGVVLRCIVCGLSWCRVFVCVGRVAGSSSSVPLGRSGGVDILPRRIVRMTARCLGCCWRRAIIVRHVIRWRHRILSLEHREPM